MIIDYVGVKEINGSLIVMDGVKGVSNEEIVDIRLDNGTMRQGRVVQIEGERIVVQVFEGTYVPLEKQKLMMKTILNLHAKAKDIVAQNIPLSKILNLGLFDKLTKMKYDIPNSKPEMFDDYIKEIDEKLAAIS